jgi:hypothetical protein
MPGESAQARIRETARNRGAKGMSGSNHNYIRTYAAARGILGRAVFSIGNLSKGHTPGLARCIPESSGGLRQTPCDFFASFLRFA